MTAMNSDSRGIGNYYKRFQGDLLWEKKRREKFGRRNCKKSFGKICVGLDCIIDGGIVDNLNVEFILLQTKVKEFVEV